MQISLVSSFTLILANLFSIYGIVLLRWEAKDLFLLYFVESIIVYIYLIVKLFNSRYTTVRDLLPFLPLNKREKFVLFFSVIFFVLNYGIYYLFSVNFPFIDFLSIPIVFVISFVFSHGFSFYFNFIRNNEFKRFNYLEIFKRNFMYRYLIMYLSINFILLLFGVVIKINSFSFFIGIILLKTIIDLYLHIKDHNQNQNL